MQEDEAKFYAKQLFLRSFGRFRRLPGRLFWPFAHLRGTICANRNPFRLFVRLQGERLVASQSDSLPTPAGFQRTRKQTFCPRPASPHRPRTIGEDANRPMTDEAQKQPHKPGTKPDQTREAGPRKPEPGQPEVRKPDEDPVGKVYDSHLIRRLGHYLKPYWWQCTVSSLAVTLKSLSDVAGPYLVKVGIDRYLTGKPAPAANWLTRRLSLDPWHGITQLAEIYIVALLSAYLFEFIQTYLMQWVGQKIMFDLRRDIFRHMQQLHVGFFETHAVGRLVTRLTSDVDAINEMFTGGVLAIVDDFFTLTII